MKKRDEIAKEFKWALEDMYSNDLLWEEDFEKVKVLSKKMTQYNGKTNNSSIDLLACLKLHDELSSLCDKVSAYARMRKDEDNSSSKYQTLYERVNMLGTIVMSETSFLLPELSGIDSEKLKIFFNEQKGLDEYKFFFEQIEREKKYILSKREEEILALSYEIAETAEEAYTMYNNADIKFSNVKDENGNEVELTKGNFIKFLTSKDRKLRSEAFYENYSVYSKHINTIASLLTGKVKMNNFYRKVRGYESCLYSSLFADNVDTSVYNNLIKAVSDNLEGLHKYIKLRKKALKIDDLHMYDLYVSIVDEIETDISYDEAKQIVKDGLTLLGTEYLKDLQTGYDNGWIDVYENEGKTSGAYSGGCYSSNPYVLLNYQGTLNDVFTLAHEMGHSLHSYYSNANQTYINAGYKIFVAEVASTVNESLLINHLINKTTDKQKKAYLINHYLEEFRGTVFRQVMFAEFEKIIHEKIENDIPLTADSLCEIYKELNIKYYGNDIIVDDEIKYEWARIPHFYYNFYVYKYSTGFSAATAIAKMIMEDNKNSVPKYLDFLKSGGSDYPIELLKKAGVDLTTPKPVVDAIKYFNQLVDELEKLI